MGFMLKKRRVVITGMGVVSPLGNSVDKFWSSLIAGESGVRLLKDPELAKFSTKIAATVDEFTPRHFAIDKKSKTWDRYILFAMEASLQAIKNAALEINEENQFRTGVYIGSGIGGLETLGKNCERLYQAGRLRTSPYFIPMMIANMATGIVSMETGASGPSASIVAACATGNNSIGEAYLAIQYDRADTMIAGGAEAPITTLAIAGFSSMKAMSTRNDTPEKACSPFDISRDGFVMGEGAGVVILEELDQALKRGAPILAEITGYGCASDAHHLTAPHPQGKGAHAAMQQAVTMSGWHAEDVDYINCHGTGTPLGDIAETLAIKKLVRNKNTKLAVSSTKSATGHLFGAAGAVEAIATIQAINNNTLPPTLNLLDPDPQCDLDYVPLQSRNQQIKRALSNGFGFGGHNAVLAMEEFSE